MRASRLYDADFDEAISLIASGPGQPDAHCHATVSPWTRPPKALAEVVKHRREVVKALLVM